MLWMTVFHFCFDLNNQGIIQQNFVQDPLWTWQRSAIVSLFLVCAGAGQALAMAQAQTAARFWRRWGQIAAGALVVSAGSWWMFPQSYIYFGVLHGIAVMLLLLRFVLRPWLGSSMHLIAMVLALFTLFLIAPSLISMSATADFFNSRWVNALGAITQKPLTEDYVPLLPWFAVMLLGYAACHRLLLRRHVLLSAPVPRAFTSLVWLGRWSLSYYLVHQPVLLGLIWLFGKAR